MKAMARKVVVTDQQASLIKGFTEITINMLFWGIKKDISGKIRTCLISNTYISKFLQIIVLPCMKDSL